MKTADLEESKSASLGSVDARTGISFRAFALGLVLVVAISYIVTYAEMVIANIQIGFFQMPPAVIGVFLFLILLNRGMRQVKQRLGLSAAELMLIYCMMLVAAMVASRGVVEKILPTLVTPNYFANPTNRWQELFCTHIKKWMVPFDPQGAPGQFVSVRFYEKLREGEAIPWGAWAVPLAAWGILVLLVVFAFLCLSAILRRQWVDNEKLTFPLVQPPLELVRTDERQPIFRNRLLWGGMALPAIILGFNGLHGWCPNIPLFPLYKVLNEFLVTPPWNAMYYTTIFVSFAAIGFFYLLPLDILFALWFFALFARLQGVIAAYYGMNLELMPMYGTHLFVGYQVAGAYVVLSAYLFYIALPHLKKVVRAALGKEKADDSQELMPYGVAFWGLFVSLGLIVGWCYLAGMSPWVALLEFFGLLFIVALVMARSTAEAGLLMTETSFRPIDFYRLFAPIHSLGPTNMTMLAFVDTAFLRDQRGLLLTGFMDGLKISDGAGIRRRSLLPAFIIGILASLIFAGALQIWLPYTRGGNTMYNWMYFNSNRLGFLEYQAHMSWIPPRTWQAPTFFIVGIIFTIFLAYMRAMFYWWPFHPLGYALCISWSTSVFWFPCLVAWVIKTLILRYGGLRLYLKVRPWFLGMIFGEFGMAVIWTLISAVTGAPAPAFGWM